jgi:hypothetical protein
MNNHITNKILFQQSCLLGNGWVDINDFEKIAVNNPATGDFIGGRPACRGRSRLTADVTCRGI